MDKKKLKEYCSGPNLTLHRRCPAFLLQSTNVASPDTDGGAAGVDVVYCVTSDPSLQTRHLAIYNTGPAVGVDLATLRKVFEAYGTVERLECPNPKWSRIYVSFDKVGLR